MKFEMSARCNGTSLYLIQEFRRQKQEDLFEFKASVVYTVSSRISTGT